MVKVEKSSESTAVPETSATRETYKINAGERIRDIIIDNVKGATSEYGEFMVINFTTGDGEKLSLICGKTTVWGRNCITTFADVTELDNGEVMYKLKDKFVGRKIWIGKSMPIQSTKKKNMTYISLEWGFED